ncbi:MAG: gamma-glutamyl-gamma-aminobutyrate hydrolase family protein [Halanaerobiaceae bacterium]
MSKAVIGITSNYDQNINTYTLNRYYISSILKAGGLPIILPCTLEKDTIKRYLALVDGILFSGGGDIDSLIYGNEPLCGLGSISPERDYFELELFKQANKIALSVLGICKGCQIINIAMGGSVYQDIYQEKVSNLKHKQEAPRWYPTHHINIIEGTYLEKIINKRRSQVNSIHHQSIKEVAAGFRIAAKADDGIIEAIEKSEDHFVVGIQWHPEIMLNSRDSILIFEEFVKRASERKNLIS